jgi:hypothetical protein
MYAFIGLWGKNRFKIFFLIKNYIRYCIVLFYKLVRIRSRLISFKHLLIGINGDSPDHLRIPILFKAAGAVPIAIEDAISTS